MEIKDAMQRVSKANEHKICMHFKNFKWINLMTWCTVEKWFSVLGTAVRTNTLNLYQVRRARPAATHGREGLVAGGHRQPLQYDPPQWLQVPLPVSQSYWSVEDHPRLPAEYPTRTGQHAGRSATPVSKFTHQCLPQVRRWAEQPREMWAEFVWTRYYLSRVRPSMG